MDRSEETQARIDALLAEMRGDSPAALHEAKVRGVLDRSIPIAAAIVASKAPMLNPGEHITSLLPTPQEIAALAVRIALAVAEECDRLVTETERPADAQ